MKILFSLLLIVVLSSCTERGEAEMASQTEIFRSSENSFQEDFYLKMEADKISVYGWALTIENDTIYYRSNCTLEQDSTAQINIQLENYELSKMKVNASNLDDFNEDKSFIDMDLSILFHSSFSGRKTENNSFDFLAVKHIYYGRADRFIFEKIK